jgi:hypothetical protein
MTAEQLRTTLHARLFQPFTIRMADGKQLVVPQPEYCSISPTGRTAVVFHFNGAASIVDLLLMTELELSIPKPTYEPAD